MASCAASPGNNHQNNNVAAAAYIGAGHDQDIVSNGLILLPIINTDHSQPDLLASAFLFVVALHFSHH